VKELIKSKLEVDCKVSEVRKSSPVIIVKIDSEEEKKEIMKNKYKLKGERLFIENELSFEERTVQEKLSRWAKEKRNKGMKVKIERGRARVRGKWITWEEIEKEERTREEKGESEGRSRERKEQNFG